VASPHDHIVELPFAALGTAPPAGKELYTCGSEEFPGSCSADVTSHEHMKQCVGRRTCPVDLSLLGNPCPNASQLQLRVRWVCHCDVVGCDTGAAPLPLVPLHAKGNIIQDSSGSRFRFNGVNWAGAHIVNVPEGLDRAPLESLARLVRTLGFNVVRLTWSVESVLTNPVVKDSVVAANPRLIGLTALEVLDEVGKALQHEGVLLWLDNHMLDTDWCCDRQDCNGFWFNSRWSEDDWVKAWSILARRFSGLPAFVGAGLKNEPHSVCGGRSWGGKGGLCNATCLSQSVDAGGCVEMAWADGPEKYQWRRAATRAANAVLKEKPSLLVSFSGLEYSTDLRDVAAFPVDLPRERVVYEAHEYSWSTWSRHAGQALLGSIDGHAEPASLNAAKSACEGLGGVCSGVTCEYAEQDCTPRSGHLLVESHSQANTFRKELAGCDPFPRYAEKLRTWWGYLLENKMAPVFLSEFGFSQDFTADPGAQCWLQRLSTYIQDGGPLSKEGGLDWAYWSFGGVQVGGTSRTAGATEHYGVLNRCWTAAAKEEHIGAIHRLMTPVGKTSRRLRQEDSSGGGTQHRGEMDHLV
jgi:hypothetical protein